jgi:syntaxin 16
MATRNRTPLYRKYRDALRHVRAPPGAPSSSGGGGGGGGGGPVIEMASLLRSDRPYAPLSTDDPSASRCHHLQLSTALLTSRLVSRTFGNISEGN